MVGELQAGDPGWAGPYRLVGRLGAGGMGEVFLGRSGTGALAAVKVIRPELAGEPGFRERFAREVAAAANVSGQFTALVLDADVRSATPWLATAYVAGPSLAEAVATQGPLPAAAVLTLAGGLAQGLGAIHAAGLVHRDLKPANVLLAADGPRVIDFGISRSPEASMLTQTGMVVGSPGFMSPEQAVGRHVGPRSDVFSLGAVLAFAATGRHPFGTGTAPMLMYRVVHGDPDLSGLPGPVWPLVTWCLAKDPALRPGTGDLLARLGGAARRAAPRESRHRVPAAAAVAGARLATVGAAPGAAVLAHAAPAALAHADPGAMVPGALVPAALAPTELVPAGRTHAPRATIGGPPTARARGAGGAGARPRARRRLAWAGALGGLAAAAAVMVVILPGTVRDASAAQPRSEFQAGPAPVRPAVSAQVTGPATAPGTAAPPAPAAPALAAGVSAHPASPVPSSPVPSSPAVPNSPPAATSPGPPVPQILTTSTYWVGRLVYVSLTYADPGNDAAGFGFAGVNGAQWPAESYSFTDPDPPGAVITVGSISYPFDLGCGLTQPGQAAVKAWIYDTAGDRSRPVTVTLACAT
jgi:hypothetical protein